MPGKVSVVLSRAAGNWKVHRLLTLADGNQALDIAVSITNAGTQRDEKSYWAQTYLRLADDLMAQPGLADEVVLMPARAESKVIQGVSRERAAEELYMRDPEDAKGQFLPPHQPWMAAIDKNEQLVFGIHFGIEDFPRDTVFYSWHGNRHCYSMEVLYPRDSFEPGQSRIYPMRMMAFADLASVDLIRPRYAVLVSSPDSVDSGTLVFKLVAAGVSGGDRLALSLGVDDGRQNVFSDSAICSFVAGGDKVVREIAVPVAGLAKGPYGVYLREADGQTFKLTGKTVMIR